MALPWTTRTFTARGATGGGEAMYPPKLPKNGSSTEDTSRPVVRTKTRKGALLFEKKIDQYLANYQGPLEGPRLMSLVMVPGTVAS